MTVRVWTPDTLKHSAMPVVSIKMTKTHIQNIRINCSEQEARAAVSKYTGKDIAKGGAGGGAPQMHSNSPKTCKKQQQPDIQLLNVNK